MTPEPVPLPESVAWGTVHDGSVTGLGFKPARTVTPGFTEAPLFTADQLHAHAREFARRELEAAADAVPDAPTTDDPQKQLDMVEDDLRHRAARLSSEKVGHDGLTDAERNERARRYADTAARLSEDGPRG